MAFEANRNLADLDPVFNGCVLTWLSLCRANNLSVLITEGKRSKARQYWLWTKGRFVTKGQEVAFLGYDDPLIDSSPKEKQVTWTLKSNHLTGKAIDFCFKTPTGVSYVGPWDKAYDLAEKCGMESLFRKCGQDKPHLQMKGLYKS